MQAAVRSYKTMGVAIVGASVVAVSPMAPPLPHIQMPALNVSSVAVELSALSNPITQWGQMVQTTVSNLLQLAQTENANAFPILGQVVTNQAASAQVLAQVAQAFGEGALQELGNTPGEFQAAYQQLASGDITNGLVSLFNAATGPVLVPILNMFLFSSLGTELTGVVAKPFDNLAAAVDVLTTPNNLLPLILTPLNLVQNVIDAVGTRAEAVVAAVQQKDPEAFANALIGLAPALIGAVINGDPTLPAYQGNGLLGPSGTVAAIQTLAQQIANAIAPAKTLTSSLAVNELPTTSAKLVALNVASPAKAVGALAPTKIAAPAATATTVTTATVTTAATPSRLHPAKGVSDGIRKASKHAADGSTTAAAGTGVKSSSTGTAGSKSNAGGSNGGGKHRASK
jgi:hypothetical protein